MGRALPVACDECGGIQDWGDFGSEAGDDATCTCEPGLIQSINEQIERGRRGLARDRNPYMRRYWDGWIAGLERLRDEWFDD